MATQETIKQLFSGGVLRDIEDADARQAITALQNALDALTSGDTTTAIENFQEVIDFLDGVTDDETLIGKITALQTAINGKQPMLTFDNAPTAGSNNPVKSGGVKTALDAKADSSNVYPKSQTYTKTEVDNAIDNALDGFTPADVPTKVSDLTNDAGYQTQQQVAAAISQAAIEAVVGSGDFAMTYDEATDTYNIVRLVPTLIVTQLDAMSENTKSGTFKVSGTNLKGDVTISTSAANWSLSVNGGTASQSITLHHTDGVLAETTITVTYGGSTDSTGNVITVSSTGAESKTVTASYTEHAGPTITTSNDGISISEVGGYTNTATLQVTGTLLTGNITAALSSGSKFSLSKNTFVQNGGTVNETLTISFSPLAGDTSPINDTLTLSSDGATSVVIQLTGTVLTQSLTLTPSSLTLESAAGTPVSDTIKVEGSNIKGDVTVGVPNGFTATLNGSSVSTLTASQVNAMNGVTLTIGNAGTTANGNLTFSVGGTQLASVPLAWEETVVDDEAQDGIITRKLGYSTVSGTTPDVDIKLKIDTLASGSTPGELIVVNISGGLYNASTGAYSAERVVIPDTITLSSGNVYKVVAINQDAFYQCTALKSISFGDNIAEIIKFAFLNCRNLEEINWGTGLKSVKEHAFDGCSKYGGDANGALNLPNTVIAVQTSAFSNCPIQKWVIPQAIALNSVNTNILGNFIFSVTNSTLAQKESLKYLDIPAGVSTITGFCHQDVGLETIIIRYEGNSVPVWANGTSLTAALAQDMSGHTPHRVDLYVPTSMIDKYKNDTSSNAKWGTYIYDATNNPDAYVHIHDINELNN